MGAGGVRVSRTEVDLPNLFQHLSLCSNLIHFAYINHSHLRTCKCVLRVRCKKNQYKVGLAALLHRS